MKINSKNMSFKGEGIGKGKDGAICFFSSLFLFNVKSGETNELCFERM